jgi:hypothetical protein
MYNGMAKVETRLDKCSVLKSERFISLQFRYHLESTYPNINKKLGHCTFFFLTFLSDRKSFALIPQFISLSDCIINSFFWASYWQLKGTAGKSTRLKGIIIQLVPPAHLVTSSSALFIFSIALCIYKHAIAQVVTCSVSFFLLKTMSISYPTGNRKEDRLGCRST